MNHYYRHFNIKVNDLSKLFYDGYGNPVQQSIEIDGFTIPLRYDGLKYFLKIREPTQKDWSICTILELISPELWNIQNKINRRTKQESPLTNTYIAEWSERLGHLNLDITKHTLLATTQLITSVEAENRITPRRHLKNRLPILRPKRLNEGFCSDTFYAKTKSIHGHTCAQIFVGATVDIQ
jgi:hypothetical protein